MKILGWLAVWLACLIVAAWTLVAMPLSAWCGSGRRGWRLAVSYDQLANVAGGGNEDETISARCWRLRGQPHYARYVRLIDALFEQISGEREHCRRAYEQEQTDARARLEREGI